MIINNFNALTNTAQITPGISDDILTCSSGFSITKDQTLRLFEKRQYYDNSGIKSHSSILLRELNPIL